MISLSNLHISTTDGTRYWLKLFLLVLISPGISIVFAQDSSNVTELPGVVVTAPVDKPDELDWVRREQVLQSVELRRKREAGLGDMLSRELGISSSSFGPSASRPIIRGQDSSRIRILENGVGMGDVSVISPDHAVATETLNASRIEILRGPSTLLYGSGTSSGVVNVISDRIPDRLYKSTQGHFEGRFNSALEERSGVFNASGSIGQFSWHIDGAKRKTNDIKIPGRADITNPHSETGIVRNSAIDSSNITAGGSYIGERGYIGLSVSHLDSFYGIPGPESAKIDMGQTRYGLAGELDSPVPGFQKLKMRMNYNDYQHDELEDSGEVGTRIDNDEVDGRFELAHAPISNWHGVMGVQFRHQDFTAQGEEAFVPSALLHSVGVFMLEQLHRERWSFEIGGRLEHTGLNPAGVGLSERNFGLYNVSAGTTWMPIDDYQINLTVTRGQRAPIINALYANGIHVANNAFEVGDSSLNRETSNNFDLSLQKTDGVVTGRINLFYNLISSYIFQRSRDADGDGFADRVDDEGELSPDGAFLVQDFAQTRANFYGLEAEARVAVLPERLNMRLFTDIVYGRLKNNGTVPRLTPQRYGLDLDYFQGNWQGNFNVTRVVRQNRVAVLETETPGYTLMNAELSYCFKRSESMYHTLFLQGRNLLDEDVRVHTSFLKNVAPLPGRAIVVGIRGTF
ncbi:MAG: TonB-dependent receptor [Nitrosomonas sp.]|nr:TonB-dependent receptor [Nitrosomonas sp.]